jgi:hypothetical protein
MKSKSAIYLVVLLFSFCNCSSYAESNKKLKVAVQFFGHLRTFEKCAPALKKHIIDLYDCDVFIHTWDKVTTTPANLFVDANIRDKVQNLYNPKKLKVDTQSFVRGEAWPGVKYMLYSKYKVNELRKEYEKSKHIKYDYVIMVRPDIFPKESLKIEDYKAEFEYNPNIIIDFLVRVKTSLQKNKKYVILYSTSDVLYFSTPEKMNIVANAYNHFDKFFNKIQSIYLEPVGAPEVAFHEYMVQQGIIPRPYFFRMTIERMPGRKTIKQRIKNEFSSMIKHMEKGFAYIKTKLEEF